MVSIISRSKWGARAPRSRSYVSWSSRVEVTLHYSTGPESQTPRQIQAFHMNSRGWADVGYNFLVDEDGRAYEGRGWTVLGAHAAPRNVQGIGICYIGGDTMTAAAKRTVIALYDEACRRAGRTLDRKGHKDINSTSCPGTKNYGWWKSKNYRDVSGGGSAPDPDPVYRREDRDGLLEPYEYGPEIGALQRKLGVKDDEYFGPVTEKAVRAYQAKHGLGVDGIAGPETLGHMGLASKPAPRPSGKKFPLPRGHWFGVESSDSRNHSGYWAADRPHIEDIQGAVGAKKDGRYGPKTRAKVIAFQERAGVTVDGLVGPVTWKELFR